MDITEKIVIFVSEKISVGMITEEQLMALKRAVDLAKTGDRTMFSEMEAKNLEELYNNLKSDLDRKKFRQEITRYWDFSRY